MGNLEQDIRQKRFQSEFNKALINLIYTSNFFHQIQLPFFKKFELTIPQFNILRILRGQHPRPATVNLLIDRMLDKSSNASRIVDRLEGKGLVIRKQCSEDRRAVDVLISEKGLDLLAEMDENLMEWEASINHLTDDECHQLNTLLDKMRA